MGSGIGRIKSVELADKGASHKAPNEGVKSSLLALISQEYVGERNSSPPLRVLLWGKG